MDFAEHDDWAHLTSALEGFANDAIDFPVQIYVTTRPFPDDYLTTLEDRLDDPDVQANPTLEALIENYVETRTTDLEETTTAPPHVYAVVDVGGDEVLDETVGETTGLERLAQVPLLGIPFGWMVRSRSGIDDEERRDRMCEELDRRLQVLQSGWESAAEGVTCTRLSLAEWLPLIEEFWTGERPAERDPGMVRSSPVVTASSPGDADDRTGGRFEADGSAGDGTPTGVDNAGDTPDSERIPSLAEVQQQQLAPEGVEETFETARTGDDHCQVLYVEGWPDTIAYGALRRLFQRSDVEYDLSIHVDPINRSRALDRSEARYRSLKGDAALDDSDLSAQETRSKADETALFRQQIKAGQTPFRVAVYVVARADDEQTLQEVSRDLRSRVKDPPAEATLRTVTGEQLRGLESAAPVGRDMIADRGTTDTSAVLLGRGVGALLASIQDSGLVDPGGIELGEHAISGKPVIVDPFDTGVNYNWTVIGDSGSGKTYFGAQTATRALLHEEDTTVVFIDPMQAFEGVAQALDADVVRVGGEESLNPLEIRPPADSAATETVDPLRQKIKEVLSLFDNFAHQQGIEGGLGEGRSLLSTALKQTYEQAGITHDVATHDRESPTIRDLLDVLQSMADSPADYVLRTEQETETISQYATRLLGLLRPFVDGEYSHLAEQSSLEFGDSDVIYMDMSGEEGRTGGGGGLTMQLVFSEAYEFAKERSEQVIIVIDEARFFMRHSTNLDFLGQRVRHSRHFDTSIRFYTQNINDFYAHSEAESIINNSAITVFHNTAEIAEWQDVFDLNDREVEFIRSAETGTDGYSEAMLDISGRRLPLQIFATPLEDQLIDFDPRRDDLADIPGISPASAGRPQAPGETPVDDSNGQGETMVPSDNEGAAPATAAATPIEWVTANDDPSLVEVWESLSESQREQAGLLTGPELAEVLRTIRGTEGNPVEVLATALETKLETIANSELGEHIEPPEVAGGSDEPATLVDVDPARIDDPPEIDSSSTPIPAAGDEEATLSEQNAEKRDTPENEGSATSPERSEVQRENGSVLSEEDLYARWNERIAALAEQAKQAPKRRPVQNRTQTTASHLDESAAPSPDRKLDSDETVVDAHTGPGPTNPYSTLSQKDLQRADADWVRRIDEIFPDHLPDDNPRNHHKNDQEHVADNRIEYDSREWFSTESQQDQYRRDSGAGIKGNSTDPWHRQNEKRRGGTERDRLSDDDAWPDLDGGDDTDER
jgi:hypothetical protein